MSIRLISKLVVIAGLIAVWPAPLEPIVARRIAHRADLYSRLPWRHISPEAIASARWPASPASRCLLRGSASGGSTRPPTAA